MDSRQFRECGKKLVDFIADYLETIRSRRVLPDVKPGFMKSLIPDTAPDKGEPWQNVFKDIEKVLMPGMTHWASPNFYFPLAFSYPSICAEILTAGLACVGFSWISCPSATELEFLMMDWLGQALNLPDVFLYRSHGLGGGMIQPQASDSTLVAFFAARCRRMKKIKGKKTDKICNIEKFVAYVSDQFNSFVERSAMLSVVQLHVIESKDNLSLDETALANAINDDKKKGLIPILVMCTLGNNSMCIFDNVVEIGAICDRESLWLHIDAAYAGSALVCPEFRQFMQGIEMADSFVFHPHKWLLTNFDCTIIWVKNREEISDAFYIDPPYLKYDVEGKILDFRHWQLAFSRGFRSLKLWFVIRMFGIEGLQQHIRNHVSLAKHFEKMVASNVQFEVTHPVVLAVVCFRLKGSDELNEKFIVKLSQSGKIHLVSMKVKDRLILQFVLNSQFTTLEDVKFAWEEITTVASDLSSKNP